MAEATASLQRPVPEQIYREFSGGVSRLCHRMLRNRETAADAAQDAWLEILKSLSTFRGEAKLSTWIYAIVQRSVMKHWQREKTYSTRFLKEYFTLKENEGMYELAQIPTEDKTAWVRLQCDECLTGIVHCLNNEDRMTYLLRVAGRLPFADIAEILEKEEPALRKSFERSRKKVSGFLNSQCFLYNPGGDCRCKIKEPIKHTDKKKEYKTVQQAARKMHFLEAADSYYPGHDYWKGLIAGLK